MIQFIKAAFAAAVAFLFATSLIDWLEAPQFAAAMIAVVTYMILFKCLSNLGE